MPAAGSSPAASPARASKPLGTYGKSKAAPKNNDLGRIPAPRAVLDRLCMAVVCYFPRRLLYWAGARILAVELIELPASSHVARELALRRLTLFKVLEKWAP